MTIKPSLLIVEDDLDLARMLAESAAQGGYRVSSATSLAETEAALDHGAFDTALVDLGLGAESGFSAIRRIKERTPDTEIVVISATGSLASAIHSYELAAFAFVQKPFDLGQLHATLDRALERRRMNLDNRRLLWELQTINEIADIVSGSLELKDVLIRTLDGIVRALSIAGGCIRLRNDTTGLFEVQACVGSPELHGMWADMNGRLMRPSDQTIVTRAVVVAHDLRAGLPDGSSGVPAIASAISVPMLAGDDLVGTLTVGASTPGRFLPEDQRLIAVIAGQVAAAIQNARLHDFVRRGKREWEQTFDAIGEPIAVFDCHGKLLRGNTALASHLGRSVTSMRGISCCEVGFCQGACPQCDAAGAVLNAAQRREVTLENGQIFSVTTFPVGAGVDAAAVVQVAKNVTEEIRNARRLQQLSDELALANGRSMAALERLKSTQAQLLQAEKLSAIGQLVAGVAHELNNPLTSVIGYAQLLEEELLQPGRSDGARPNTQLAHDLRRIAEESERAARIVRNLLSFARRQSAERAPQDVADLFGRVLSLRSYELRLTNVELVTEFDPGLPRVVADGSQLQQALLNLMLNAEQAMRGRAGRRLRVGARFDEAAAAVELFVADTGHGIDDANLSRIFDPFFTTRDVGEGTGLGLSLCYGIVRDHGGQITVESRVNSGTTFSLLFPALVDDAAGEPILVAHADQGERDYVAAALRGWGYDVLVAASSAEALAATAASPVQAMFVDRTVIAADLEGWRRARASQQAPLVLMSTAAEDGDVDRFGREQASAVLAPPFQLRAIRSAVRAVSRECV